jgi:hypothetical protein
MRFNLKNTIYVILLINFSCFCNPNTKETSSVINNKERESLKVDNSLYVDQYIKIYGILKYFHPDFLSGKGKIDQVFVTYLLPQDSNYSLQLFNKSVSRIIKTIGDSSFCRPYKATNSKTNSLFAWIDKSSLLDQVNKRNLIRLTQNINQRDKLFYASNMPENVGPVTIKNEIIVDDKSFPSYKYRILSLAKYWNIINFYYPYKSQIDSFDQLNLKYLPQLSKCRSENDYHLTILKLTSEIKDGHTNTRSDVLDNYFGQKYLPFIPEYSCNRYYVSKVSPNGNKFRPGDILLKINNKSVDSIAKEFKQYISSKNEYAIQVRICSLISRCKDVMVTVKLLRNNDTLIINSQTITYTQHYNLTKSILPAPAFKQKHTEYFNLYLANISDIKNGLEHADTVIFDLRFYIKNNLMYDIAKLIFLEETKYILISMPDLNNPGNFINTSDFYVGSIKPNPFKGTLIVIINENTISQAETACLIFSKYKNAIFVGRNTCGANGDKVVFNLPGKITTQFSGVGVFELNRNGIQNIGIKPDIYIQRLPKNIAEGTDEIFKYLNLKIE